MPPAALQLDLYAPAEAQVAAIADDIAYNSHDLDDGLRAGLIDLDDLADVPLAGGFVRAGAARRAVDQQRTIYEVNRRIITAMIDDVVRESRARLAALARAEPAGRARGRPAGDCRISASGAREIEGLQGYLFANVYRHPRVMRVMDGAETHRARPVRALHGGARARCRRPGARPPSRPTARPARATVVSDFVAGMTDRYAIAEHRRLFDATPELR